MSGRAWRTVGAVGGTVVGLAAASAAGLAMRRRSTAAPAVAAPEAPLGSLRATACPVIAEDGVPLHVEVDEPRTVRAGTPTIVFVHGWALTHDSWHFQRAAFRDQWRMVFYDHRSHGRSGRSARSQCTLEQLGRDLGAVIDQATPDGPLVLVGHSMGGMTIMSLAEQFAEMVSDRVVAVALLSTSAGGVIPVTGGRGRHLVVKASPPVLSVLATAAPAIEAGRRATGGLAYELTRRMGFGGRVSDDQVRFIDAMIAANPLSVFTDFYPLFTTLDMHEVLRGFSRLPTLVVAGGRDAVTPVRHSRRIAELIPTAELVIFEGAGHLVMMERAGDFNRLLGALVQRGVP